MSPVETPPVWHNLVPSARRHEAATLRSRAFTPPRGALRFRHVGDDVRQMGRFELLDASRTDVLRQRFVGSVNALATAAEFRVDAVAQVVTGLNASVRRGQYGASLADVRQAQTLTRGLLRQLGEIEQVVACRAAASTGEGRRSSAHRPPGVIAG